MLQDVLIINIFTQSTFMFKHLANKPVLYRQRKEVPIVSQFVHVNSQ